MSVMTKETQSPYSFEEFQEFLAKEHSNENIDFFLEVMAYREKAQPIFGNTLQSIVPAKIRRRSSVNSMTASFRGMRRISSQDGAPHSPSGTTSFNQVTPLSSRPKSTLITIHGSREKEKDDENSENKLNRTENGMSSVSSSISQLHASQVSVASNHQGIVASCVQSNIPEEMVVDLKSELDHILATFICPGSRKEINISGVLKKKLMTEIRENKNFNPEMFRDALEKVLELMRNHSFPLFCQQAHSKPKRIPNKNGSGSRESSVGRKKSNSSPDSNYTSDQRVTASDNIDNLKGFAMMNLMRKMLKVGRNLIRYLYTTNSQSMKTVYLRERLDQVLKTDSHEKMKPVWEYYVEMISKKQPTSKDETPISPTVYEFSSAQLDQTDLQMLVYILSEAHISEQTRDEGLEIVFQHLKYMSETTGLDIDFHDFQLFGYSHLLRFEKVLELLEMNLPTTDMTRLSVIRCFKKLQFVVGEREEVSGRLNYLNRVISEFESTSLAQLKQSEGRVARILISDMPFAFGMIIKNLATVDASWAVDIFEKSISPPFSITFTVGNVRRSTMAILDKLRADRTWPKLDIPLYALFKRSCSTPSIDVMTMFLTVRKLDEDFDGMMDIFDDMRLRRIPLDERTFFIIFNATVNDFNPNRNFNLCDGFLDFAKTDAKAKVVLPKFLDYLMPFMNTKEGYDHFEAIYEKLRNSKKFEDLVKVEIFEEILKNCFQRKRPAFVETVLTDMFQFCEKKANKFKTGFDNKRIFTIVSETVSSLLKEDQLDETVKIMKSLAHFQKVFNAANEENPVAAYKTATVLSVIERCMKAGYTEDAHSLYLELLATMKLKDFDPNVMLEFFCDFNDPFALTVLKISLESGIEIKHEVFQKVLDQQMELSGALSIRRLWDETKNGKVAVYYISRTIDEFTHQDFELAMGIVKELWEDPSISNKSSVKACITAIRAKIQNTFRNLELVDIDGWKNVEKVLVPLTQGMELLNFVQVVLKKSIELGGITERRNSEEFTGLYKDMDRKFRTLRDRFWSLIDPILTEYVSDLLKNNRTGRFSNEVFPVSTRDREVWASELLIKVGKANLPAPPDLVNLVLSLINNRLKEIVDLDISKPLHQRIVDIWTLHIKAHHPLPIQHPTTVIAINSMATIDKTQAVELVAELANDVAKQEQKADEVIHINQVFSIVEPLLADYYDQDKVIKLYENMKSSGEFKRSDRELKLCMQRRNVLQAITVYQGVKAIISGRKDDLQQPIISSDSFIQLMRLCMEEKHTSGLAELFTDLAILQASLSLSERGKNSRIGLRGIPNSLIGISVPADIFVSAMGYFLNHKVPEYSALVIKCALNAENQANKEKSVTVNEEKYVDGDILSTVIRELIDVGNISVTWVLIKSAIIKKNFELVQQFPTIVNALEYAAEKGEEVAKFSKVDGAKTLAKYIQQAAESARLTLERAAAGERVLVGLKPHENEVLSFDQLGITDEYGIPLLLKVHPSLRKHENGANEDEGLLVTVNVLSRTKSEKYLHIADLTTLITELRKLREPVSPPVSLLKRERVQSSFLDWNVYLSLVDYYFNAGRHQESLELIRDLVTAHTIQIFRYPSLLKVFTSRLTQVCVKLKNELIESGYKFELKTADKLKTAEDKEINLEVYLLVEIVKTQMEKRSKGSLMEAFLIQVCTELKDLRRALPVYDIIKDICYKREKVNYLISLYAILAKLAVQRSDKDVVRIFGDMYRSETDATHKHVLRNVVETYFAEDWVRLLVDNSTKSPLTLLEEMKLELNFRPSLYSVFLNQFEEKMSTEGKNEEWEKELDVIRKEQNSNESSILTLKNDMKLFYQELLKFEPSGDAEKAKQLWESVFGPFRFEPNVRNKEVDDSSVDSESNTPKTFFERSIEINTLMLQILVHHPTDDLDCLRAFKIAVAMFRHKQIIRNDLFLMLIQQLVEHNVFRAIDLLNHYSINKRMHRIELDEIKIPWKVYAEILHKVSDMNEYSDDQIYKTVKSVARLYISDCEHPVDRRLLIPVWQDLMVEKNIAASIAIVERISKELTISQHIKMLHELCRCEKEIVDIRLHYSLLKKIYVMLPKDITVTLYNEMAESCIKYKRYNLAVLFVKDCAFFKYSRPFDDVIVKLVRAVMENKDFLLANDMIQSLAKQRCKIPPRAHEIVLRSFAEDEDREGLLLWFYKMVNLVKVVGWDVCGQWEKRTLLPLVIVDGESLMVGNGLKLVARIGVRAKHERDLMRKLLSKCEKLKVGSMKFDDETWEELVRIWELGTEGHCKAELLDDNFLQSLDNDLEQYKR
ncbi:hypothetical protein HK098_000130 [Nowakowskiella sp. JEL0407]|nr:hypothetical protein HK098_000130 [Nowakowskiella sp. JEL0407]